MPCVADLTVRLSVLARQQGRKPQTRAVVHVSNVFVVLNQFSALVGCA